MVRVRWKTEIDAFLRDTLGIPEQGSDRISLLSQQFHTFFFEHLLNGEELPLLCQQTALFLHFHHLALLAIAKQKEILESGRRPSKRRISEFTNAIDAFSNLTMCYDAHAYRTIPASRWTVDVGDLQPDFLFHVIAQVGDFVTPPGNDFLTLADNHRYLRSIVHFYLTGNVSSASMANQGLQQEQVVMLSQTSVATPPPTPGKTRGDSKFPNWRATISSALNSLIVENQVNIEIDKLRSRIDKQHRLLVSQELSPHRQFSLLLLFFRNLHRIYDTTLALDVADPLPCWTDLQQFRVHSLPPSAVNDTSRRHAHSHLISNLLASKAATERTMMKHLATLASIRSARSNIDIDSVLENFAQEFSQIARHSSTQCDVPMPEWFVAYARDNDLQGLNAKVKLLVKKKQAKLQKHSRNIQSSIPCFSTDDDEDDSDTECSSESQVTSDGDSDSSSTSTAGVTSRCESPPSSDDDMDGLTKKRKRETSTSSTDPLECKKKKHDIDHGLCECKSNKRKRAGAVSGSSPLPDKRKRNEPVVDVSATSIPVCDSCRMPFDQCSRHHRSRLECRICSRNFHFSFACLPESFLNRRVTRHTRKFICPYCDDKPFAVPRKVINMRKSASFWMEATEKERNNAFRGLKQVCASINYEDVLQRASSILWKRFPALRKKAEQWYAAQMTFSSPPNPPDRILHQAEDNVDISSHDDHLQSAIARDELRKKIFAKYHNRSFNKHNLTDGWCDHDWADDAMNFAERCLTVASDTWKCCEICESWVLQSELDCALCCANGSWRLTTSGEGNVPEWPSKYVQMILDDLHWDTLQSHGGFINNELSTVIVAFDSVHPHKSIPQKNGYRPPTAGFQFCKNSQFGDLYLGGRTYYKPLPLFYFTDYYDSPELRDDAAAQVGNVDDSERRREEILKPPAFEPPTQKTLTDFRAYLFDVNLQYRWMGWENQQIIEQRKRETPNATLRLHPDEVVRGSDLGAIGCSAMGKFTMPNIRYEYIALPLSIQRSGDTPRTDDHLEGAAFPLLYPNGYGGWGACVHSEVVGGSVGTATWTKYPTTAEHPYASTYKDGTPAKVFTTLHVWMKFVTMQCYMKHMGLLPRVFAQYALDSLSRQQDIRFAQLEHNKDAKRSYQRRVAQFSSYIKARREQGKDVSKIGIPWNVPPTIPGSPGYQRRLIADGMAIISALGPPTLFITITMPLKCKEMEEGLEKIGLHCKQKLEGEHVTKGPFTGTEGHRHPSLVVRVFRSKLKKIRESIMNGSLFGQKPVWYQRTIEYQKRGLIHAHILLRLAGEQPYDEESVDRLVSARKFHYEKCPKYQDPSLSETDKERAKFFKFYPNCQCNAHQLARKVDQYMMHNCSGEKDQVKRCEKRPGKSTCSKHFPKPVTDQSYVNVSHRWEYKREPQDQYVVAYNPALLSMVGGHCNVEIATGQGAASYIRKYLSKMPETVRVRLVHDIDSDRSLATELREYQKVAYRSESEAHTRNLKYAINDSTPSCECVHVHLPGRQSVWFLGNDFDEGERADLAVDNQKVSKFMHYLHHRPKDTAEVNFSSMTMVDYYSRFSLQDKPPADSNKKNIPQSKKTLYFVEDSSTMPQDQTPKFVVERRDPKVIRLSPIPFSAREIYCLRQLVDTVAARSFDDYKRLPDGNIAATFTDAAKAYNLIRDDEEPRRAMEYLINKDRSPVEWDAAHEHKQLLPRSYTAERIQAFFITNALDPATDVKDLFEQFWPYMLPAIPRDGFEDSTRRRECLRIIDRLLSRYRLSTAEINLEHVSRDTDIVDDERKAQHDDESNMDIIKNITSLNDRQQIFHDHIIDLCEKTAKTRSVSSDDVPHLFYLQGDAGCGKSWTIRRIIADLRLRGHIVLPCAFMGSVANALPRGETLHHLFKLPIPSEGEDLLSLMVQNRLPESKLSPLMQQARVIKEASLIVIDEISMVHRAYFKIIDALLRQITEIDRPFGGKLLLVTGDFKQIPPVLEGASNEASTIAASILSDSLWSSFQVFRLFKQERSVSDQHTQFCAAIGRGLGPDNVLHNIKYRLDTSSYKSVPHDDPKQIDQLRDWCFDNDDAWNDPSGDKMFHNTIVAFRNDAVNDHNDYVVRKFLNIHRDKIKATVFTATSELAEAKSNNGFAMATPEVLQSISPGNMPPHRLSLFPGCVISVCRNLNIHEGLSNGTKLIVAECNQRAKLITAYNPITRKVHEIKRVIFEGSVSQGVKFHRYQFPVRIAYAQTSNRSQGATYAGRVVFDTSGHSFTHGQVYVGFSRVVDKDNLRLISYPTTVVTVYQRLLQLSADDFDTFSSTPDHQVTFTCPPRLKSVSQPQSLPRPHSPCPIAARPIAEFDPGDHLMDDYASPPSSFHHTPSLSLANLNASLTSGESDSSSVYTIVENFDLDSFDVPFEPDCPLLPPGFRNSGNTCYVAASLQLLCSAFFISTPPFTASSNILATEFPTANQHDIDKWKQLVPPFLADLRNTCIRFEERTASSIHLPRSLLFSFPLGPQQDAHEYLQEIVDVLSESYVHFKLPTQPQQQLLAFHDSLIAPTIFNNCYYNICGHTSSSRFQQYRIFLIPSQSTSSIQQLWDNFFAESHVDGRCTNKLSAGQECSVVHSGDTPVIQTTHLLRSDSDLPPFLLITVKQNSFDQATLTQSKSNFRILAARHLNVTSSILQNAADNTPNSIDSLRTVTSIAPLQYELWSFTVHVGQHYNAGHYVAYCTKEVAPNEFIYYKADDQNVSVLAPHEFFLASEHAYTLLYKKSF